MVLGAAGIITGLLSCEINDAENLFLCTISNIAFYLFFFFFFFNFDWVDRD